METTHLTATDLKQLERHDHCLLKNVFGLPRRTRATKFYAAVDIRRLNWTLLDRKITLLRNLLTYDLTRNLLNSILTNFNNSDDSGKVNFKESWIHELATEVKRTSFVTEDIIMALLDKLNMLYQEDAVLLQHDHEVKAIRLFIEHPSDLNKRNVMDIIRIPNRI